MRVSRVVPLTLLIAAGSWLLSGCVVTGGDEPQAQPAPEATPARSEATPEVAETALAAPENTTRYVDPDAAFSIALPNDWEHVQDYEGTEVLAVGPPATPGGPAPTVNVVLELVPAGITLDDYFQKSQQNLGTQISGFTVDEKGDVTLGGLPGKWMASRYQAEGQEIQALTYFVVNGERAYVITCGVDPGQFATYRERFQEIATSLALTEPTAETDTPAG